MSITSENVSVRVSAVRSMSNEASVGWTVSAWKADACSAVADDTATRILLFMSTMFVEPDKYVLDRAIAKLRRSLIALISALVSKNVTDVRVDESTLPPVKANDDTPLMLLACCRVSPFVENELEFIVSLNVRDNFSAVRSNWNETRVGAVVSLVNVVTAKACAAKMAVSALLFMSTTPLEVTVKNVVKSDTAI